MTQKIITLEQFKENSRIDGNAEDQYIENIIIPAATNAIQRLMRRTWEDVYEENGYIPEDVISAILMLADSLYKNRGMDANVEVKLNPAFRLLIVKHIKLTRNGIR